VGFLPWVNCLSYMYLKCPKLKLLHHPIRTSV
jgi:hypothetical protein